MFSFTLIEQYYFCLFRILFSHIGDTLVKWSRFALDFDVKTNITFIEREFKKIQREYKISDNRNIKC